MIPGYLLNQVINIIPYEGEGGTGKIWGTEFTIESRFEPKEREIIKSDGDVVKSKALIFVPPKSNIMSLKVGSKVEYNNESFEIVEIQRQYTAISLHHIELWVI